MAIDTAQKRASAIGQRLPAPDGSTSQDDRQQLLGLYAGILAGLPWAIPLLILVFAPTLIAHGRGSNATLRAHGRGSNPTLRAHGRGVNASIRGADDAP